MPKKILIIIIIVFVVLILGLFVAAYVISQNTQQLPEPTTTSPFGEGGDVDIPIPTTPDTPIEPPEEERPVSLQPLRQLTDLPVSGAQTFFVDDTVEIQYIDRATGNLYKVTAAGTRRERLTNTTILGIQEVVWNEDGSAVIVRYLDDDSNIKSFSAQITATEGGGVGTLAGTFLADNIPDIIVSPDKDRIFYLANFGSKILGITADFDGGGKKQVFEHDIKQWTAQWPASNTLTLTTKPSREATGYSFSLPETTGQLTQVFGGFRGLTTLYSPTMEYTIFSDTAQNTINTHLYNTAEKAIRPFSLNTLPEKCVWSTQRETTLYCGAPEAVGNGSYPDSWYKGRTSFVDNIWEIDVESGSVSFIISPVDAEQVEVDVINPFLSENDEYLFFTNKKDGVLWSLRLP